MCHPHGYGPTCHHILPPSSSSSFSLSVHSSSQPPDLAAPNFAGPDSTTCLPALRRPNYVSPAPLRWRPSPRPPRRCPSLRCPTEATPPARLSWPRHSPASLHRNALNSDGLDPATRGRPPASLGRAAPNSTGPNSAPLSPPQPPLLSGTPRNRGLPRPRRMSRRPPLTVTFLVHI